jgi:hypothetical protein
MGRRQSAKSSRRRKGPHRRVAGVPSLVDVVASEECDLSIMRQPVVRTATDPVYGHRNAKGTGERFPLSHSAEVLIADAQARNSEGLTTQNESRDARPADQRIRRTDGRSCSLPRQIPRTHW